MLGFGKKKDRLKNARIAVLVSDGVEQTQLDAGIKALRNAGAETYIVALRSGKIQAMRGLKTGAKVPVDVTIDEVHPASFAGLVIPGGALSAERLRQNEDVREFVRAFERNRKPIAAIGHAGWVLASAGVLPGKKLTAWPGIQDDIANAGAQWVDEPYVADANLLTGRASRDIKAFRKHLAKHFNEFAPA